MNKVKGKLELRVTEEEKKLIKTSAAKNGKPVNKYVIDLVKEDNERKEN